MSNLRISGCSLNHTCDGVDREELSANVQAGVGCNGREVNDEVVGEAVADVDGARGNGLT